MSRFILRKLIAAVPVVLTVSLLVFLLTYLAPGDPVLLMVPMDEFRPGEGHMSQDWQQEQIDELRRRYGLDRPLYVQYADWLWRAVQGDLGNSVRTRQPVTEIIVRRLPVTLELALLGLLLAVAVGIPLGVIAAVRQDSTLDTIISVAALAGVSLPSFWLAILLILGVSVKLGWLPPGGFVRMREDLGQNLMLMVLPAVTLSIGLMAGIMRMTRSSLVDVLGQDYLVTARSKGLGESIVVRRHALINALIPVVTMIGLQLGRLLGGATFIEVIFSIPGLGKATVDAINGRDYPIVQGAVLLSAVVFVLVNIVIDVIYGLLDPRVRYE